MINKKTARKRRDSKKTKKLNLRRRRTQRGGAPSRARFGDHKGTPVKFRGAAGKTVLNAAKNARKYVTSAAFGTSSPIPKSVSAGMLGSLTQTPTQYSKVMQREFRVAKPKSRTSIERIASMFTRNPPQ